jgi:SAM-dependent methyltransferase
VLEHRPPDPELAERRRRWYESRVLRVLAVSFLVLACHPSPRPAAAPPTPASTVASPGPTPSATDAPEDHAHPHAHVHEDGSDARPTADHRFTDAARWSKVFDDPKRDAWQKPAALVAELGLRQNAVVVDLGAGTGYFAPYLSRAVPQGRVVAVDVEPELVGWLERRVAREGLKNVTVRLGAPDDPKLEGPIDAVLVVDTYHHIGHRIAYFRAVRDQLAPAGRVVIVDFRMGDFPVGPPDSHKLPAEQVEREMTAAGYRVCRRWDGLAYQYAIFFGTTC